MSIKITGSELDSLLWRLNDLKKTLDSIFESLPPGPPECNLAAARIAEASGLIEEARNIVERAFHERGWG